MKWFTPLKSFWTKRPKNQRIKLIVMLFILAFILLMFPQTPTKKASNSQPANMMNQPDLQAEELEALLSELTGNKVRVMVAYADSGELEIVREETTTADTKTATGETQHTTDQKPVLDANKNIQIKNKHQPRIKGVCIFYFGPYERETEDLLYRAAKSSLGADLHTVEVVFQTVKQTGKP